MTRHNLDGVTIYEGEALNVLTSLPSESVDAVLTDPPYCSGAFTLAGKQRPPNEKYSKLGGGRYSQFSGDARDQRSFTLWASLWLGECLRLAREGAPLLVFSDWRQLPAMTDAVQTAGWHWRGVICWHKPAARPMRGEFKRDCEFVVYARKGRPAELDEVYLPGMFSMSAPMGPRRVHLTQKPVELIKNMLQVVPKGGVVLDPFLGSGTTAVAAIQTGRSCIGVEITPDNVAIARDRVARRE